MQVVIRSLVGDDFHESSYVIREWKLKLNIYFKNKIKSK